MYNSFAYVYDEFMENVPYERWAKMLADILRGDGIEDGLLLDLGCGTGTLTRLMADLGYDMTGVDLSADMLSVAREYEMNLQDDAEVRYDPTADSEIRDGDFDNEGEDEPRVKDGDRSGILYLCQDMREFELYGTVRAVYSLCDCLNYITEYDDLVQVFKLVNNYLDPGGLFIFDMNTIHKFSEVLGDRIFAENGEDASFIWDNHYDEDTRINEYDLTLFIEEEDGRYIRETELHRQKGYSIDEVKRALDTAGLVFLKVSDEDTGAEVTDETERVLFIARESGK
ncbi:MAG: class I SAM-dependent methyltransferase [Lachnospiraceae bacterium]|nr:class I SAM-dependent methyltransferase [Lachnospiraceae bacterium]